MITSQSLKRLLLGRTLATEELEHTLLPKVLALPVFSSDPLSSNAYATQEILLVLGAAGGAALSFVKPISFAVAILLATVVVSYRQTVRAYPNGGGAYIVAHENLGTYPGLLAAAALLIDYVLTVSVSITAGVDAIVSAATSLADYEIEIAVGFVAFVTLMNLRGTKESGTLFAIPTYGFVISIYLLLGTGFVRCLGGCPLAESAGTNLKDSPLTLFLILKAFSAGTTALTGVEAVSNGVPAFRYPQSENAAKTLTMMGVMSISMFLGLSWLANHTGVVYTEESERTVVAQIAHVVFGGGIMFYIVQVMTAGILILAANTAYQDFPRLSSILAKDRFMPRQFMNRGDRLVFSNGIVILAVLASLLIVILKADLNRLIQLYLVGVFISFTLSQAGMVVHWRKTGETGWKHRALVNGFGSMVTGVVFFVVVTTKFFGGAWIVVSAIPVIIFIMASVGRHYRSVAEQLAHPEALSPGHRLDSQHFIILVSRVDAATARAVGYARAVRPRDVTAVTFDRTNVAPWKGIAPEIPLRVLDGRKRSISDDIKAHLRAERIRLPQHYFLTLVIPEILERRGLVEILRRPGKHRLKASLLHEPGIQVLDIPIVKEEIDPDKEKANEAARNYVVVLVAGVHKGTMQAIRYGESLRPTDIRAVSFGLDPEGSEKLGNDWIRKGVPLPLEIEDAPFREIGSSLTQYVRQFRPDGTSRVVTVVIPEFVVRKRRHQVLHGQTALVVKRHLLFEGGVVVASVPYRLER
ncbi:MAG: APC family permease [Actinobacteria bacterium]|nr:APC family permease [Actinomycetota bacterium]